MKKGRETRREREKGRKTSGEESEWEKGRKKQRITGGAEFELKLE